MKGAARWIYTLGLGAFFLGMSPLTLWQVSRHGKYRRGLGERFGRMAVWEGGAAPLWLHTVSVGEAMAAATLARDLRRGGPRFLSWSRP